MKNVLIALGLVFTCVLLMGAVEQYSESRAANYGRYYTPATGAATTLACQTGADQSVSFSGY